jgi:hypothetical protein
VSECDAACFGVCVRAHAVDTGAVSASVAAAAIPLDEREIFGRMSLTLELIVHPTNGVKVCLR